MAQKVIKVGTSDAVVVHKDVKERLGIKTGDKVDYVIDDNRRSFTYILRDEPRRVDRREARIVVEALNFIDRFSDDLEAL